MKQLFLIIALSFLSSAIFATSISLDDAISSAKENNLDYALAVKTYKESVELTNRESSFTPTLSLTGNVSTGMSLFSNSGFDFSWSGVSGSVGISTGFTFSGSKLTESESKAISNESALLSLESSESELESSVISSYYTLVLANSQIELYRSYVDNSKENLQSAQEKYDSGLISELVLIQAENALSEAEYALSSAEAGYELYIKSFENLTGLDVSECEFDSIENFEPYSLLSSEELFERYAYSSPQIKALDLNYRSAELSLQSAKNSAYIPTLNIGLNYGVNSSYNTMANVTDGLSVSASISMSLDSLFSSSSTSVSISKAENSVENAQLSYQSELENVEYNIEQYLSTISLLSLKIENQQKIVSALEKECDLTRKAYDAGEESLASVTDTESSLLSAKCSLLELECNYMMNVHTLSQYLGVEIENLMEN